MVEELGGAPILGRPVHNAVELRAAIREGFPKGVVDEVMHSAGLSLKELAGSLDLSPRSLHRRRREGRLARHESDRLYHLARIIALAKYYLGDDAAAMRWLKRPNRARGKQQPPGSGRYRTRRALGRRCSGPHRVRRSELTRVYRILRRPFSKHPLDGEGAYRFGGRWSGVGTRLA